MQHISIKKEAQGNNRMFFLDNLRAFIVLVVIVFHVAIGYTDPAPQWWYVVDTQHSKLFNLFVMNTDVFIMPIMFLISGYFSVPVLQRKGVSKFLSNKFIRIGLPWLAGIVLFAPAITYMIWFSRSDTPPDYLFYLQTMFFKPEVFNHAHYWFLGDLFWFFVIVTAVYKLAPALLSKKPSGTNPSLGFWLIFCLFTAAAFLYGNLFYHADEWFSKLYFISFQPTRFLLYVGYFTLGIHAWRNSWFTDEGYMPSLRCWCGNAMIMLAFFTMYRISFSNSVAIEIKAGHALLHSFLCLTVVFAFIAFFYNFVNTQASLWKRLSANSFTIYYIHQFVVLPVSYMVQKETFPVAIKYFTVASICVILSYVLSEYIINRGLNNLLANTIFKSEDNHVYKS